MFDFTRAWKIISQLSKGQVLVSVIPLLVRPPHGKIVSSWSCSLAEVGLQDVLATERGGASAVSISSWVHELSARKGCLDSLRDDGKSTGVFSHMSWSDVDDTGVAGSISSVVSCLGSTSASRQSTGDAKEVQMGGSSGVEPSTGDAERGCSSGSNMSTGSAKISGKRSLGTRISKISGAITRVHKAVR